VFGNPFRGFVLFKARIRLSPDYASKNTLGSLHIAPSSGGRLSAQVTLKNAKQ
jgi:hypothetical protein